MHSHASTIEHSDTVHAQARLLTGWDQTYSQIGLGPFSGSFGKADSGTIRFFDEQMNREVLQNGAVPESKIGFGVPMHVASNSYLCGEPVDAGQLLVFSGASGFEFLSPQSFRFYGIEIDCDGIDDPRLIQLTSDLRRIFAHSARAITLNTQERRVLAASLDVVYHCAMDMSLAMGPMESRRVDALNRQIIGTVLDCLSGETDRPAHVVKHWDIVTRIRDLVKSNPLGPRTVAELTVELGLSRRTLQNACRDILDVSPVRYLRSLRLSEVRQAIETASSVTDVATEYGFWHLSYFARDYRAMFGEAPSKTLERYRRG